MPPRSIDAGPLDRRHGYSLARPLTDAEWARFLPLAQCVRAIAGAGVLPATPDRRFARASVAASVEVAIGEENGGGGLASVGVAVRGRGLYSICRGGPSLGCGGAPLFIARHALGWSCETHGRPYDGAVRLILILLRSVAPDAVRTTTTAPRREWAAAERFATHELCVGVARAEPAAAAVQVEPIGGTDLWRAQVGGVELAPVGVLAVRRDGRAGFAGRLAALAAAEAAAARFGAGAVS